MSSAEDYNHDRRDPQLDYNQLKLSEKYMSFAFQDFATPDVEDMYKELKGTKGN